MLRKEVRRVRAGLCRRCDAVRETYAQYCDACAARHREQQRRRRGLATKWTDEELLELHRFRVEQEQAMEMLRKEMA